MNINCTIGCMHQKNGKCALQQPKRNSLFLFEESVCPYYEKNITTTKSIK